MSEAENRLITNIMHVTVESFLNRMVIDHANAENSNRQRRNIDDHGGNSSIQKESSPKQKRKKNSGKKKDGKQSVHAQFSALGLLPPPDMPESFKNKIESVGGTEIKRVIQKFIYQSDDNDNENRLSMPFKQLECEFTTEEEERELDCKKNKDGMEVMLIEPSLEESHIHLTKWKLGGSNAYVFKKEWNQIRKKNGEDLKKDSIIQVWSFRVGTESKLGFAIVRVRKLHGGLELDLNPKIGHLQLDLNQNVDEPGLDLNQS